MSLTLDRDTRTRLDQVRSGIVQEFHQLPQEEVNARFDAIVNELVDDATFPDFVPVLAWRYSRESLKSTEGVPGDFRPPRP